MTDHQRIEDENLYAAVGGEVGGPRPSIRVHHYYPISAAMDCARRLYNIDPAKLTASEARTIQLASNFIRLLEDPDTITAHK